MIVQAGLNASTLSWRAIVYDFLDELREVLGTGEEDYRISFLKVAKMIEQGMRLGSTRVMRTDLAPAVGGVGTGNHRLVTRMRTSKVSREDLCEDNGGSSGLS
jgi:hypothetical protein